MTSPTPQQLAQSGTLEDLYKQLEPIRLGAGWAKPRPSLWAEPKKSFQAVAKPEMSVESAVERG